MNLSRFNKHSSFQLSMSVALIFFLLTGCATQTHNMPLNRLKQLETARFEQPKQEVVFSVDANNKVFELPKHATMEIKVSGKWLNYQFSHLEVSSTKIKGTTLNKALVEISRSEIEEFKVSTGPSTVVKGSKKAASTIMIGSLVVAIIVVGGFIYSLSQWESSGSDD
jgi:hypothetical protein